MKLTNEQSEIHDAIMSWVKTDKNPVAILVGSAGTGKTTLLKSVVESLESAKKTYVLLAPTGRAARILGHKTGKPARTIHSEIYELRDIRTDEQSDEIQGEFDSPGFTVHFKLKDIVDSKATVYIVDEASMVSDKTTQNEIYEFGTGRLLHDLLHYARIINCKNIKSKILFVGDEAQLPPVKCSDSPALLKKYFLTTFKINPDVFMLHKVLRQAEGSLILENAEKIRDSISSNKFGIFHIDDDGSTVSKIGPIQAVKNALNDQNTSDSVIITVRNIDALSYNQAIRRRRFGAADIPVQIGDILLVCRNNNKFFNGDLVIAVDVDPNTECRSINIRGSDRVVDLCYRNVIVRPVEETGNGYNQQCKIIENILRIPSPMLSPLEYRATMVDFRKRHSKLEINSAEFRQKLISDEYFNALLVKYGYAINCHKAQGGEWDNVSVSFSGFPGRDSGFFRWAYTAITRGKKTLGVIDPPSFGTPDLMDDNAEIPATSIDDDGSVIGQGIEKSDANIIPAIKNNRGARWSSEEDNQLQIEFSNNKSINEIAKLHGRTKGAIHSRLKILGLIDSASIDSSFESNQFDLPESSKSPESVISKQHGGTWKKIEFEKVFESWKKSDENYDSIKRISLEIGRSDLAIIIQLYKAELITLEQGDLLSAQCNCIKPLSVAINQKYVNWKNDRSLSAA